MERNNRPLPFNPFNVICKVSTIHAFKQILNISFKKCVQNCFLPGFGSTPSKLKINFLSLYTPVFSFITNVLRKKHIPFNYSILRIFIIIFFHTIA